jgi:hypothetical protein
VDYRNLLETVLNYGKGPICRGLIWVLVAIFGSKGLDAAKAGDFVSTIWPAIASIVLAGGSLAWSVQSDKKLHNADPPQGQ